MIESDLQIKNTIMFSKEEDIILIQLVRILGIKNWRDIEKYYSKISKEAKRDQKQLKSRWINYLEINCKKLNWDIVEEYIFFEFRTKLGNRWSPIAKVIPSKSDNDVKNHFHSNLKKMFRKLMKKKFDINCIYEKIRAFYFMNYIKSKYENFVNYYDPINNSINFDAIKEKTELITNVDDKAICDLVIDQKGSIKIVNNTLNEVCLMIISDPLSVQLIEKLDEKYLTKNIKDLKLFNFEEEESQILINMIIKLHVFYNLKNFERREEIDNKNTNKIYEDTSNIKSNNSYLDEILKNKWKLKISKDFKNENKDNEIEGCEENKNKLCYKNSNQKNFTNNLENKYSDGHVNMNEKFCIINRDKDNLLKDLTSNNFMEYNLGNFNRKEGIKNKLKKKFSKNGKNQTQNTKNLYDIKGYNLSESKENHKNLNSKEFSNKPVKNIYGFSKIPPNQQSIKNYDVLNKDSKPQNNRKIIKTLNLKSNFCKSKAFENQKNHKGFEIFSSQTKIMERVEYGEILERFFESDELRCLLEERNLLDLQEGWNKKVNKEKNNSNQLEILDSKYKKIFIEKLSDFYNTEFNQPIKIRDYNIKIEKKIDTNKEILSSNNPEYEIESNNLSNFKNDEYHNVKNFVNTIPNYQNNNEHIDFSNSSNKMNKKFDEEKIEIINNQIILSKQKNNYRLKKSELSKKSLINVSQIKNDILDEEKKNGQNLSMKLINKIFDCQKIEGNNLKRVINDPTNCTIDFDYKREEKQTSPKISICDDLKEKYPSVEEENLLNTNYCYISNSLLDKLMNLQDTDIFLKIIEKIVVNNIVYSMFNKEKYSISSNLKFNNKNLAYIYTNRENDEYNIIKNKNAYSLKCFVDNSNNFIKIKSFKIDPDLKIFSSNFEDEKFYNIYNKIKINHKISKSKNENSIYEIKDLNNDLDLNENVSSKIKMNNNSKQNVCDNNENRMMMDTMNNSLDDNSINYIRNVNGFQNNRKFNFLLKNSICNLENEKMQENCNMNNLNPYKIVLNKNFCLKSNYMDNFNAIYETNSERFTDSAFKNLEINNFNFHYNSKKTFLRRKKRAEY